MSSTTAPEVPLWGTEVIDEEIDGRRQRVYRYRPRSVAGLLGDIERWGPRTAIVQGARRISAARHRADIDTLAAHLAEYGVRRGDRVMLLAANSPEWVTAFWAAHRLGAVTVLANAWWSEPEVGHAIETASPKIVVADERRTGLVTAANVLHVDTVRSVIEGDPVAAPELAEPTESDPAVILFTSGTVTQAKGVLLNQRAVVANLQNILVRTRRLPTLLPDDYAGTVSLMCLPLFHIGGLQTLIGAQLTGGRVLFLEGRFDADTVLSLIETERVRFFGGVPTMVARLLECPRLAQYDTSSLVSVAMGGSLVAPELAERIERGFPAARRNITSIYGQTEAGGALTSAGGTDLLDRPGCVGRPLPIAEIRIDSPDADGVGEVIARAPTLMVNYWPPGSEQSPIDADGWLHTGDLGRFDEDGYLYIVGRSREIIIRGGENVAPGHVENCLLAHPAVADVAVVGLPHPTLGEEVAAAVVLRPGYSPGEAELREFATAQLARFEVPSRWRIGHDPLRLNAAGKVAKRELVAEWISEEDTKGMG
jgi:long-chain acyl-CoA synthetase